MKTFIQKHALKIGASVSAVVASGVANATVEESLNAAVSSGQSNYSIVVIGLIGLAAIGFGLRAIMGAMR
ncbi:hypothetical protein C1N32_16555 [Vibrio diazotrophicus]|uniref:Major coat protein n=1 Tax=Vibrio diazotrophicus TaxID=685 RepID=A0A2J8HYX5_VIBDI|nr:hypothetical protein [Vibrio diazotrophicus]AGN34239.1 hypothetical protein VPPG_00115 [Vibrio phage VD1]PNI03463.1 hypothetical protein C1N32_16555 [Vibrio diazotrophicus]